MYSRRYRKLFLVPALAGAFCVTSMAVAQPAPSVVIPDLPGQPTMGLPPSVAISASSAGAISPSSVKVYDAGAVAPNGYTVIRRVSASNWLSALTLRTYATDEGAKQALLDTAARDGGDGVMNMQCLRSAGPGSGAIWRGYYCYGNIIKLKSRP